MAPYRGSPAEQPEERLRRHPPRPAHRDHRGLGLGQVIPRVRHPLRGRPVAVYRVALDVRAHVPRTARPAPRGPERDPPALPPAPAEEPGAHPAVPPGPPGPARRTTPPPTRPRS